MFIGFPPVAAVFTDDKAVIFKEWKWTLRKEKEKEKEKGRKQEKQKLIPRNKEKMIFFEKSYEKLYDGEIIGFHDNITKARYERDRVKWKEREGRKELGERGK